MKFTQRQLLTYSLGKGRDFAAWLGVVSRQRSRPPVEPMLRMYLHFGRDRVSLVHTGLIKAKQIESRSENLDREGRGRFLAA